MRGPLVRLGGRLVLSPGRFLAMLGKELIEMRRDRLTFAMMLGVPLMQLLLFGYAINTDARELRAALVAPASDHYTRAIVSALELSDYYRFVVRDAAPGEAEQLIARGEVALVVTIPTDIAARVARGERPQILVEADATNPWAISGAVGQLAQIARAALLRARGEAAVLAASDPAALEVVVHKRWNPEGISQYNIVPGLLGVILQMTMVMMTAMALTRESERGTMEALLATPASPAEIMLGKILPYFLVGAGQTVVVLVAARVLFAIPFEGRLGLLMAAILLFVSSLVLLGYTISTFARNQMQAMQITFFYFLPSILLSGFAFPFEGMPAWARWLGEVLFPLTHFLRIVRAVMLKGADLAVVAPEMRALAVFLPVFALMALLRFRRTLD